MAVEGVMKLFLMVYGFSIMAFVPLAFGVGYGTMNFLSSDDFTTCTGSYNSSVAEPSIAELNVVTAFGYITAVLFCCSCFVFSKTDNDSPSAKCMACLWLLVSFTGSCLFMHIFTYLDEVNDNTLCASYTQFVTIYNWSVAGVVVGSLIVSMTCCVVCCVAMIAANGEQNKPAASNNPYARLAGDSATRTVAVRNQQRQQPQLTAAQARVVGGLLSLAVVEECGFCIATPNNRQMILNRLQNVSPMGQTALRDAVIFGIQKMLALKVVIAKLGVIQHKFVHIVLTDGCDTGSQCTLTDTQRIFYQLGREIGDICTTFFIGVGLGYSERAELQSIADLGGDACELYNCQDVQLSDVFDRIKIRVGIRRNIAMVTDGTNFIAAQQDQLYMQAEQQKFLVLFTLDKSGSMSGGRWRKVCMALNGFCQGMGGEDILGVILFNERVQCITDR